MWPYRNLLIVAFLFLRALAYGQQQDLDFHPNGQFLTGKTVLKVKRDFNDPYLWVLVKNNEVYRINSITMTVDDYTPQFAQYNNLQFIDIAGLNRDTVFVATNSTNVVAYKKGSLGLIGASDGLVDTVNSVGISNFSGDITPGTLQIGTAKGRGQYNISKGTLRYNVYYNEIDNRIYEASYRNFSAKENFYQPPLIPVSNYAEGGGEIFQISPNSQSGINVTTAFGTHPYLISPGYGSFYESSVFWGNENGLFEESQSNLVGTVPYNYKLQGIRVNKITDILGFTSLGSPYNNYVPYTLSKENLLVGTDEGLYFSSSIYGNFDTYSLHTYAMFHYDLLGNVPVNDICVNGTASEYDTTPQGCEDGVWVACNSGLYFIKPDYAKYLDPKTQLKAVMSADLQFADTTTTIKICTGDTAKFYVDGNVAGNSNNTIQWVKDGVNLQGKTRANFSTTQSGDYYAIIHASCENVYVETNHYKVQVMSAPVFSFNYRDKIQYCDSTSTTLKIDNNPLYHYRWYTNGALNGDTTYHYTATQSGKYKVEVSACTNSWVPSKEIEVDLVNLPAPVITADKAQYCVGDNAVLSVNAPADPSYKIQWYQNGNLISTDQDKTSIQVNAAGSYSVIITSNVAACTKSSNTLAVSFLPPPVFQSRFPDKAFSCAGTPVTLNVIGENYYHYHWYTNGALNGDTTESFTVTQTGKYKVEASSCEDSWVSSNEIEINMISLPIPVIKTDKKSYCIGDNANMSIAIQPDAAYTINWFRDNVPLSSYQNQTSVNTNLPGNYTVEIVANNTNTDGSVCNQISGVQNITFNPLPTVSIQQIVTTTLCDGQTVDLKVSYDNGTVRWNNGESANEITVSQSATYTATVTNPAGCTETADINVQFFSNPTLNIPDYSVCLPANKTAKITAPGGMASYIWNNQKGGNTFIVDHPQTVTLTVTDANGCQATQNIQVVDDCPNVNIPNTFTPNGDGVNDTWNITGLEYDPTSFVSIFTRYGQQVYQSRGYNKPWDGTSQGKQLPAGTYYYIIKMKNGTETFSGYVALIY